MYCTCTYNVSHIPAAAATTENSPKKRKKKKNTLESGKATPHKNES